MKKIILILLVVGGYAMAFSDTVSPAQGETNHTQVLNRREAMKKRMAEARAKRKAMLDAMAPEEREAFLSKQKRRGADYRAAERVRNREAITAKLEAAKAACGPNCYRIEETNALDGTRVYFGLTKEDYEAFKQWKASVRQVRHVGGANNGTVTYEPIQLERRDSARKGEAKDAAAKSQKPKKPTVRMGSKGLEFVGSVPTSRTPRRFGKRVWERPAERKRSRPILRKEAVTRGLLKSSPHDTEEPDVASKK